LDGFALQKLAGGQEGENFCGERVGPGPSEVGGDGVGERFGVCSEEKAGLAEYEQAVRNGGVCP